MAQALSLSERHRAARVGALLALALLLAQTGALIHGYAHLTASSAPAISTQPCMDCLSFSPLLAAAGAMSLPQALLEAGIQVIRRASPLDFFGHPPQHSFQPRAPPLAL